MKKRVFLGMLAILLTFGIVLGGCSTMDTLGQVNSGIFQRVALPDKDFTALGLVFSETSFDRDLQGARGDIYTYQALLKKAQELGADYIINVVIDVKREKTYKTFGIFSFAMIPIYLNKGKDTWYGSATAIKYTDTLKTKSTIAVTSATESATTTTTTTGEGYIMNGTPTGERNPVMSGTTGGGGIIVNLINKIKSLFVKK